jgi:hypothetical protein
MTFDDLVKIPPAPAGRILSQNNVKLETKLDSPASASIPQVLSELAEKAAPTDMMHLIAHALPPREATWWACLAAREMGAVTASVKAAEAWVRQPGLETRIAAREALDTAKQDDDTFFCAMAACFADGTMGPGEYDDFDAPPGGVGEAVYGMVVIALFADEDAIEARQKTLLERGLNIARGGNGQIQQSNEPNTPEEALTTGTTKTVAPDANAKL